MKMTTKMKSYPRIDEIEKTLSVSAFLLASIFSIAALASNAPVDADNSKVNQRDRAASAVTADQQTSGTSDMEVTRSVRQALVKQKALSVYFHNIKIVTQDGVVTLKGPVRSKAEKAKAESLAKSVAGVSRVDNLLSIKR